MTRAPRRSRRTTTAAILLAVAVTGCDGGGPGISGSTTDGAGSITDGRTVEGSATPSPGASSTPDDDPSADTDAPTPGSMERPATTSGPLDQDDFPRPATLGAGWEFSVDPGNAEEGYVGNGTPALARNPREVVRLAVPLGCPRPRRMPVPEHALEVDYKVAGTKVVTIRGEFEDDGMAKNFFTSRTANLRSCVGRSGGEALGPLVATAETIAHGVLLSDRTPESVPWAELAVLDGDQVVLVAAQSRLGTPPMTADQARRLARIFRR